MLIAIGINGSLAHSNHQGINYESLCMLFCRGGKRDKGFHGLTHIHKESQDLFNRVLIRPLVCL